MLKQKCPRCKDTRLMCFEGGGLVQLADGKVCPVREVKQHDLVHTPDGPADVICVVRTSCADQQTRLAVVEVDTPHR